MKVLSLFSGIGAFEKALNNIGINYELVNFCEFDKYATKSYCAVHGVDESKNLGDITQVDEKLLPKDIDLITYGFPCQDISVAGKGKGFFDEKGNTTRSGLFFDALRIIEETKPKYAIAENVKNLTSKKFKNEFGIVLDSLNRGGYNNYWKVLNTKDYGIPQNRERVFIVSIRKDIDDGSFKFPEGFPLEKKLKDLLEDEVDKKYYLSEKQINYVLDVNNVAKNGGRDINNKIVNPEIAKTISCRGAADQRADVTNFVIDNKSEMTVAEVKEEFKVGDFRYDEGLRIRKNGVSPCLSTTIGCKSLSGNTLIISELNIRKLTPKECWRLQGFDDESFERAAQVNSNTQLYKQAGNSITVKVLEYLLKELFKEGD